MDTVKHLTATLLSLFHDVHAQLREEVARCPEQALAWVPAPDTNSIGTLVTHLLGSEAEMLRSIRGLPVRRQREQEFGGVAYTARELLSKIDAADADLDALLGSITEDDLFSLRSRPNKDAPQEGCFWLVRNYGHAREHLAHLQLTRQLYEQTQASHEPQQRDSTP